MEHTDSKTATRVKDVMTRGTISCAPTTPIPEVARLMAEHRIHAVFVLDSGSPVGVVSDVDLLAGEWLATDAESLQVLRTTTAGQLMTAPVETINLEDAVEEAKRRMGELRIARLLVCDGNRRAVGVLSVTDLVRAASLPAPQRRVVSDVMSHAFVTSRADAPMSSAVRAMSERRSRSIVVIERGQAVGVLTGGDVVQAYATSQEAVGVVRDFMSSPVETTTPDVPLPEAVDRMLEREIHRLVVVDPEQPGEPIGIISTSDIVAEMADERSVWQREARSG
jgi:CBS domain-containing protein